MLVIFTLYSFDCFMLVLNQFVTNPIQSIHIANIHNLVPVLQNKQFIFFFQLFQFNLIFFSFLFNFLHFLCFIFFLPILFPPSCFLNLVSFILFPPSCFLYVFSDPDFPILFNFSYFHMPFTFYRFSVLFTIMLCLFYFPNLILMSYFPYPVYFLLFLTSCLLSSVSHKMLFIFLYFRNPIKRFLFSNCVSIIN